MDKEDTERLLETVEKYREVSSFDICLEENEKLRASDSAVREYFRKAIYLAVPGTHHPYGLMS